MALVLTLGLVGASAFITASTAASAPATRTISFATSSFTNNVDPTSTASFGLGIVTNNTYDALLSYPYRLVRGVWMPNYKVAGTKFAPSLAVSYTHRRLNWTFTLRRGVMSCAGNELTSKDVVYSFARALASPGSPPYESAVIAGVFPPQPPKNGKLPGDVVATGKYTVRIRQLAPTLALPHVMSDPDFPIMDAKSMRAHATKADPWSHKYLAAGHTAGYGPYCVAGPPQNNQTVLLANSHYWAGKPFYTKVVMRYVSDAATRLAVMQSGGVDGTMNLAPAQFHAVSSSASVYSVPNNFRLALMMNFKIPPWSLQQNAELRQAIAAALPYPVLLASGLKGASARYSGVVPPTYNGFLGFPPLRQDLSRARQLLAQAGFPNGSGLDQYASGLTLYYDSDVAGAYAPAIVNQITTALAAIGIHISGQGIPDAQFNTRAYVTHDLPMALVVGNMGNVPDAASAVQLFYAAPSAGGNANISNYDNPQIDALAPKAVALSGAAYTRAVDKEQGIVWKALPEIPIAQMYAQIALRRGMTGWKVGVLGVPTFALLRPGG